MARLLADDSSISLRMARRSSVAETTGKRMTSMHPNARTHWTGLNLLPRGTERAPRHSQKAGSAKSSHARFSSSSIKRVWVQNYVPRLVFQRNQIEVNVTSVLSGAAAQEFADKTFLGQPELWKSRGYGASELQR